MGELGESMIMSQSNLALKAKLLNIETEGKGDNQLIGEIIEFRNKQNVASRLAENITGFRPEDPEIIDIIIKDQADVLRKYNLPNPDLVLTNIERYQSLLEEHISQNNIKIIDSNLNITDLQGGFSEESGCITIDREYFNKNFSKENALIQYLMTMAHEMTHASQYKIEPETSIEQKEYEAYIACLPIGVYLSNGSISKDIIAKDLFSLIFESTISYMAQGGKFKEEWHTQEHLLINADKITPEQIQDYNNSKSNQEIAE